MRPIHKTKPVMPTRKLYNGGDYRPVASTLAKGGGGGGGGQFLMEWSAVCYISSAGSRGLDSGGMSRQDYFGFQT